MPHVRPRILVIGSTGFVGGWVARLARDEWQVIETARRASASSITSSSAGRERVTIDLAQPDDLPSAFDAARPDVVILTAAMADIDRCQREPELAELLNHRSALAVARECCRRGARLVFASTGAVFDGHSPPYAEDAAPTPVSEYGRTKAAAEQSIRGILPDATIVRPSLVLGFSAPAANDAQGGQITSSTISTPANNSYLDKFAANVRAGRSVGTPVEEWRNPIDVVAFVHALLAVAARPDATGVFHVGSSDKMSRYELARRLATELGASPDLVKPQSEFPPLRAPRGRDDFLVCERLPALTGFVVPTCDQVIRRAVHGTS